MKDYLASIEKLRKDAAEACIIRDLATDPLKREMYAEIASRLDKLAGEIEAVVKERKKQP